MKWLIGIAIVMVLAHLYFKLGTKRLERQRREREAAGGKLSDDAER